MRSWKTFKPFQKSLQSSWKKYPSKRTLFLPHFVDDLRNISNRYPVNQDTPSIEEIQKHLNKLKSGKASNNIDPEILKRCEHPIMLRVIHRLAQNLWSELEIPNAWGN